MAYTEHTTHHPVDMRDLFIPARTCRPSRSPNPPTYTPNMRFIDIISLCLSILGIYGLLLYLRFLLPRHVIPRVASALTEAIQLLDRAEAIGAVPRASEYRASLAMYESRHACLCNNSRLTNQHSFENQLLRMRTESHRSPGIYQQLLLAVRCGLTCRLWSLSLRIEAIKVKVEVRCAVLLSYSYN